MREPQPVTIHLKDYTPPAFLVERIALDVDIRDGDTLVGARLRDNQYSLGPERLVVADLPAAFTLETLSRIVPQKNTRLEGLYASQTGFVTQCEAEGFRRIT